MGTKGCQAERDVGGDDEMTERCCGTCKHNKRDWINPNNPDFYCDNEDSDNYAYNTAYRDGEDCEDWGAKDG